MHSVSGVGFFAGVLEADGGLSNPKRKSGFGAAVGGGGEPSTSGT